MPKTRWSCNGKCGWGIGLLIAILLVAFSFNPGLAVDSKTTDANSDSDDEIDRSMRFVEKSVQATDLFNERKFQEALVLFQELTTKYADLDEDGFVAMGLGDCLHALGRDEDARKIYQAIAVKHAGLKTTASMRIREIDLASPEVSDAVIDDLRRAAGTSGDNRVFAQIQLGRALQKRAASLLKEAVAIFRTAAEEGRELTHPAQRTISNQSIILAEIQEDLASLIERVEKTWGLARTLAEIIDSGSLESDNETEVANLRAVWRAQISPSQQADVQVHWGKGPEKPQVTVNGQSVRLDSTQAMLIQRHQQRMNAVIQEALANQTRNKPISEK